MLVNKFLENAHLLLLANNPSWNHTAYQTLGGCFALARQRVLMVRSELMYSGRLASLAGDLAQAYQRESRETMAQARKNLDLILLAVVPVTLFLAVVL